MTADTGWHRFTMALAVVLVCGPAPHAEPYIAVQKGLECAICHTSASGGGKRTAYGNAFAQTEQAGRTLDMGKLWTGEFGRYFALGGDLRGGWNETKPKGQESTSDTELEKLLAYFEINPFPGYLTAYVDVRLAPDDPVVREKWVRLTTPNSGWTIRAGEFFLPYGLRLQDDDAFVRQVSGINFNTPDTGWEVGYKKGRWSGQLAVTRGTAGGPEIDSGKQYSLRVGRVTQNWQAGGSLNLNDSSAGDRQMQNIFAGIRTGPVTWLAEIDYIINDGTSTGRRTTRATLLEANYGYRQGHNLKATFEWLDPDDDVSEDQQNRASLVWEYTPIQFTQIRIGYRDYGGIPQNPGQNRRQLFAEFHVAF